MAMPTEQQIRARARALLAEGGVELFVGYRQGSNPLRVAPHAVADPAEANRLVWSAVCINNLAAALHKYAGRKVGIVLKGCDGQTLAELLRLNQVRREDLYIVGVVCPGIADPEKVTAACGAARVTGIEDDGAQLVIRAGSEEIRRPRAELLFAKCATCASPAPPLYDELLGEQVAAPSALSGDRRAAVAALEAMDGPARFAYWSEQLSKCTLCYACQTVCPLCFCKQCPLTLDRDDPRRKNADPQSVFAFHIMRAYHLVGRCTGCDECERVCPVDIPLSTICRKVEEL